MPDVLKHWCQLYGLDKLLKDMIMQNYSKTSNAVRVTVSPIYLESQSVPEENQFLWAYHVKIDNLGKEAVCLKKRFWKITDALGRVKKIEGDGVVGEQPYLGPGESYEYTSGTSLVTSSGFMVGFYTMEKDNGEEVEVQIPAFSLDSSHEIFAIH